MLTNHLALVSTTKKVGQKELSIVAAALQKQVTRDFGPLWNTTATVDAFRHLTDVPVGYWPIIIKDDIPDDTAAGYHIDKKGQPLALVAYAEDWPIVCSHECLEMLADPYGNRIIAGDSPKDGQGRVNFLVEVCDASEDDEFGYTVNGVLLSDFYTPQFFDPEFTVGGRYSFKGVITKPRQVLKNGYMTWFIPGKNEMWQMYVGERGGVKYEKSLLRKNEIPPGNSLRTYSDRMSNKFRKANPTFKSKKENSKKHFHVLKGTAESIGHGKDVERFITEVLKRKY